MRSEGVVVRFGARSFFPAESFSKIPCQALPSLSLFTMMVSGHDRKDTRPMNDQETIVRLAGCRIVRRNYR